MVHPPRKKTRSVFSDVIALFLSSSAFLKKRTLQHLFREYTSFTIFTFYARYSAPGDSLLLTICQENILTLFRTVCRLSTTSA